MILAVLALQQGKRLLQMVLTSPLVVTLKLKDHSGDTAQHTASLLQKSLCYAWFETSTCTEMRPFWIQFCIRLQNESKIKQARTFASQD